MMPVWNNPIIIKKLKDLTEMLKLQEFIESAKFKFTSNNVPLIIVKRVGIKDTYSVCWFNKSRHFKIFFPYGKKDVKQEKTIRNTETGVINFLS